MLLKDMFDPIPKLTRCRSWFLLVISFGDLVKSLVAVSFYMKGKSFFNIRGFAYVEAWEF